MRKTFYHVDRRDALAAGETVELEPIGEAETDDGSVLEALYPDGLSNHGRYYCTQDLYDQDSDDLWDFSCELIFEQVRAAEFPERPSRLQSVFGFRTLQEAEEFAETFVDSPCSIWRVTTDEFFVGDMELVDAEDYAHGVHQANYYWRGRTFVTDPLWEVLLVPPVEVVEHVAETPST